jgi:hypothetical protein
VLSQEESLLSKLNDLFPLNLRRGLISINLLVIHGVFFHRNMLLFQRLIICVFFLRHFKKPKTFLLNIISAILMITFSIRQIRLGPLILVGLIAVGKRIWISSNFRLILVSVKLSSKQNITELDGHDRTYIASYSVPIFDTVSLLPLALFLIKCPCKFCFDLFHSFSLL